jgi:hypothetical protein
MVKLFQQLKVLLVELLLRELRGITTTGLGDPA